MNEVRDEMIHEMKRKLIIDKIESDKNIVPCRNVQLSVDSSRGWCGSIFIGVSLKIPITKRLTFLSVAQELFIFCLAFGHLKQITLAKVFSLYHFFWLAALTTKWVEPSVLRWDAAKIGISDTGEMFWHQHLANFIAKLLVRQGGLVSELSDNMVIQNRPQTLFCRKIT